MAVLSLYVLYVVGMNVFLSTSLFDRVVNQAPEMLDVHYRDGWSIFPGRIHARELSIRSSDNNVEWRLSIDEIEFDVHLLALVQRRFDVARAHGRGISMRIRQKLDAWPDTIDEIAQLPPIDGFPAFSVRPAGPPSLERWEDSKYELWTIRLEDVIAEDVREVWIDRGRFEGDAHITGRFYLKPIRAVEIGPAHVLVRTGRVTAGASAALANRVGGTADVTAERFDPRAIEGNGVLRYFTIGTDLSASLADPAMLPFGLPGDVTLSSEVDAPRLAVRIERGVLAPGTRIELETPRALVSKANIIGYAAVDLTSEVVEQPHGSELRAKATLKDVALVRADAVGVLRAPRIDVTADAHELDLATEPLRDAHAVIDVSDVDLPDASVLEAYLPEAVGITSGSARANARVEVFAADRRATGNGTLHADDLDARLAKIQARGTFDVSASFGAFRWEKNLVEDANVSIRFSDGKLASESDPRAPKIEASGLLLEAKSHEVDLADPLRSLEASFEMRDASLLDLELLASYLPKKHMKVVRGRSRFALDGHVAIEDHLARGELHARSRALGFELGDVRVRAAVDARAKVHDWKWEHGDLAIDDASIDVTGVTISKRDDPKTLASIDRIEVGLRSQRFAFADPLARVDVTAKLLGGKVTDPAGLDAFLPDRATYGFASNDGTFDADARLEITKHTARGRARVRASRMGVRTASFTVHGDTVADLAIDRWDLEKKLMSLGASRLAIRDVHGRFGNDGASELTGEGVELTGKTRDLDIAHPVLRGVDARLVLGRTEIPDARALQVLVPAGKAIRIESGAATAYGTIELSSSARTGQGTLALDITHGGVAISKTRLRGDFALRTTVAGFDPDTSTIDLSGSHLALRDVSVDHAAAEAAHWKGDVVLEKASLRVLGTETQRGTSDTPTLDAIARLDADDARPLLGILLRDSVPKLLVGLVQMPKLRAYARLHVAPQSVVVSDVSASGGDIALRGSFALQEEGRRGAFVVEKGPVSVGLRLDNDGTSPRFFGLDGWLREQERTVKDVKARVGASPEKELDDRGHEPGTGERSRDGKSETQTPPTRRPDR